MPFLRLARFPGVTREPFDRLARLVQGTPAPDARLLFAAGPVPGGYQVVQVWRSKAELDAFNREVFLPALAAVADAFPHPPEVTDVELDVLLVPAH